MEMAPQVEMLPPPGRTNRMMLVVFGTGAAIGLQSGLLHAFLWRSPLALVTFPASSLVFAAVVYALWQWVFPRLGGQSFGAQLALEAAVSLVTFAILSLLTTQVVVTLLGAPSLFGTPTGAAQQIIITPEARQMAVRVYALLPILPTLFLALMGYHQIWHRVLALQHRARELTELAATAQLAALRAQINPHFLFNSLNTIAQLIRADPDKAEACVERLADIFRYILRRAEKEFVPLAEELRMTEAYLELERARFGDRLQVWTTADPPSMHQLIPNLILQPLVENAIKHGLARKVGSGTLRIDAQVGEGRLTLTVGDDGLGMPGAWLDSVYERGVGLKNLRDRLVRLYGPACLPEIASTPGAGTQVRLRLPLRAAEAAA